MKETDKLPKGITDIVDKETVKNMLENMENTRPFFIFIAATQFIKFTELKQAGFSTEEAIELCKGKLFPDSSLPGQE